MSLGWPLFVIYSHRTKPGGNGLAAKYVLEIIDLVLDFTAVSG